MCSLLILLRVFSSTAVSMIHVIAIFIEIRELQNLSLYDYYSIPTIYVKKKIYVNLINS